MTSPTLTSDRRVAVVTGAARGIGLATSVELTARGFDIVAVDLTGAPFDDIPVDDTARIVAVEADVSDPDGWTRIEEACRSEFSRVDVLFNNAGWEGPTGSMLRYSVEDFDRIMAVNVRGVLLGMQSIAPIIKASGGGSIINMSSIVGTRAGAGIIGYAASKHAVIGLTRTAAVELAPHVRVNAVCPSPTSTRMMDNLHRQVAAHSSDDEFERDFSTTNPQHRFARADEVASAVVFLASEESSYVNGAIIPVDGGASAR